MSHSIKVCIIKNKIDIMQHDCCSCNIINILREAVKFAIFPGDLPLTENNFQRIAIDSHKQTKSILDTDSIFPRSGSEKTLAKNRPNA